MSTREEVLSLLETHKGEAVSGERIARALNLSRNAVWKAVKALRADGHLIESLGKHGYRLSEESDVLSAEGIKSFLCEREDVDVHVFPSLASTNITAKELAIHGAMHGTVVFADTQNAGRGRFGRSFYSPPGCGLYMSVVLKPERLPFDNPTIITSIAAALTLEAIEALTGLPVRVKWVNDLYINEKKICGILTEAVMNVESGAIDFLVVGIGVNVNTPGKVFPDELNSNISSILIESEAPLSRCRLAAEILSRIIDLRDPAPSLALYREKLLYVGERVTVHAPGGKYEAVILSVDDECHLRVRTDDGRETVLSSGEISIRRM